MNEGATTMTHTETHSSIKLPMEIANDGTSYFCVRDATGDFISSFDDERQAAHFVRSVNALPSLVEALEKVHALITEGAPTGFNPKDGNWAQKLFESQQSTSAALALAKGE